MDSGKSKGPIGHPGQAQYEQGRLFDSSMEPMCILELSGGLKRVNAAFARTLGYCEAELLARPYLDLVHPEDRPAVLRGLEELAGGRGGARFEGRFHCKDGSCRWLSWSATATGQPRLVYAAARDITDRKQAEDAAGLSLRLLQIANRHSATSGLLEEFVAEVKRFTGCAAVGIRLLDDDGNIPYQAYEGFSRQFYELESPLSIESDQCMCINVITGQVDPELPFYTEGGSFYMNGTTRFLATVDPQQKGQTRNVCNEMGYESVALVPISLGGRVLGLIHVADERENMVPLGLVQTLEAAAMQLGAAVERVRAEQGLQQARDELERRVQERTAELEKTVSELGVEVRDRLRAEQSLREHAEIMEAFFEHTLTPVALLDRGFNFIRVNRSYAQAQRQDIWEFPGRNYFHLYPSESKATFKQVVRTKRPHQAAGDRFVHFNHPEWGVRYRDWALVPVLGATGQVRLLVLSMEDVTEHKQAEQMLRESEKLVATGRLAAQIAHEINNPLAGIKNSFLLIKGAVSEDHPHHKYVARIEREIERIAGIVRQMFRVHRPARQDPGPFAVEDLLRDIAALLESDCRLHGATIATHTRGPAGPVVLERDSLFQVLLNLLQNAIEASPRGGTVTVTTQTSKDHLIIAVADEGDGVPPELRQAIFEPFFTTKSATGRAKAGLGLGLSVSRNLAEAMGGSLDLAGGPGRGAAFRVKLPLVRRQEHEGEMNNDSTGQTADSGR